MNMKLMICPMCEEEEWCFKDYLTLKWMCRSCHRQELDEWGLWDPQDG